jgi:hypothetical protein
MRCHGLKRPAKDVERAFADDLLTVLIIGIISNSRLVLWERGTLFLER